MEDMHLEEDIQLLSATRTLTLDDKSTPHNDLSEIAIDDHYDDELFQLPNEECLARLLIGKLSLKAKETISHHLDAPSIGQALHDWQHIAHEFGINSRHIRGIFERCRSRDSPTMFMLDNFASSHTVSQLVKALEKNQRLDVIAAICPYLYIEHNWQIAGPSASEYGSESGIESSRHSIQNHPNASNSNNSIPNMRKKNVLLTYASDSDKHIKMIRWLCTNLRQDELKCNIVKQEEVIQPERNITDCINLAFKEAHLILIVLSPLYRGTVESSHRTNDQEAIVIRYLYKLIQNEYVQNGCQLNRIICIIFDKLHGDIHSTPPGMLSNTLHYAWPEQNDKLCKTIKNKI